MFHDTINLNTEQLSAQNAVVLKQEDLILEIFKANPDKRISPSQMLNIFQNKYGKNVPITSIRRGLTNLTTAMKLVKTKHKVPGLYNLDEHTWILPGVNEPYQNIYRKGNETAADNAIKIISASTNKLIQKDLFQWPLDNDKK